MPRRILSIAAAQPGWYARLGERPNDVRHFPVVAWAQVRTGAAVTIEPVVVHRGEPRPIEVGGAPTYRGLTYRGTDPNVVATFRDGKMPPRKKA